MTEKIVVEVGEYIGSCCSLIVEKNGTVRVLVSKDQLKIFSGPKNYEFHFDEEGKNTGTGCCVAEGAEKEGEKLERNFHHK